MDDAKTNTKCNGKRSLNEAGLINNDDDNTQKT